MSRASGQQAEGYTYSYDMLGEAARTEADARNYHLSYSRAISAIAVDCVQGSVAQNPGISVKLSALHPRYEVAKKARVMEELVPRVVALALLAKSAGMGFNIDAEEADRLALSLDVIEVVLRDPALKGWDGFGIVVQAYGQRAGLVIDHLYALAGNLKRRIMVRLVKGAYWDAEIKRAQVDGMPGSPHFKHRIDAIIENFRAQQKELDKEKSFMLRQWAKREKNLFNVLEATSGMYGDMQGIAGNSMQAIAALEHIDDADEQGA